MRDKEKCMRCKYRTRMSGDTARVKMTAEDIGCFYVAYTGRTATRTIDGKYVDLRGDGDECKLFVEGDPKAKLAKQF